MKESSHKDFQVGTIQWMSYPKKDPMESLKAICRDDYFDAVEVKGFGADNEAARALLGQSHLKVCYGAQPRLLGGNLNPNHIPGRQGNRVPGRQMAAGDKGKGLCPAA